MQCYGGKQGCKTPLTGKSVNLFSVIRQKIQKIKIRFLFQVNGRCGRRVAERQSGERDEPEVADILILKMFILFIFVLFTIVFSSGRDCKARETDRVQT